MVGSILNCILVSGIIAGLGCIVGSDQAIVEHREHPLRGQIVFPKDVQPEIPEIGEFLDTPGTNGGVEFTRISGASLYAEATHSYLRRSAIGPVSDYIILTDSILNLSDFRKVTNPPFSYEYVSANTGENVFFGWAGNELRKWNVKNDESSMVWIAPGGVLLHNW